MNDSTPETTSSPGSEKRGRRVSPKALVAVVVLVLVVVVAFQNTDSQTVDVFFWDVSSPTWLLLLVMLVAGALIGSLLAWRRHRR